MYLGFVISYRRPSIEEYASEHLVCYFIPNEGLNILFLRFYQRWPLQPKIQTQRSVKIEICVSGNEGNNEWRVVQLSFDRASNINVISQKLATTILRTPLRPLGRPCTFSEIYFDDGKELQGVDVVWCLAYDLKRVYGPTLFLVSSEYDPPYDVRLGKIDTLKFGL